MSQSAQFYTASQSDARYASTDQALPVAQPSDAGKSPVAQSDGSWSLAPAAIPTGGTTGQVVTKTASSYGWADPEVIAATAVADLDPDADLPTTVAKINELLSALRDSGALGN